jgi:hypothetical protein
MEKTIKEQTGDCAFVVKTEYDSVDDAAKDINPGEVNTELLELRINSTKYKLKKNENTKDNINGNIAADNSNNIQ